jgi:gluconolactonase
MKKYILIVTVWLLVINCSTMKERKTTGSIERLDASFNNIVSENAIVEILAEGYDWSEGPVWIESKKMLLFSDVPKNIVYKWTEEKGAEVYLTPSGYTGSEPSQREEPGSNGLALDHEGYLVLCQHGDRRIAKMDAFLDNPAPAFITLVDNYEGKLLNSPNDLAFRSNGDFFFTDPPYGLPTKSEDDPIKEIPFQGVYKVSTDGKVTLLVDSITRPNGIALTPDEKTLIVANSDSQKRVWYAFDLTENDSLTNTRIFYDATADKEGGAPDGFKIDRQGNVFASGPGGLWVFNKEGKVLGRIKLPANTSNCALADNDKTLYITCDMYLLRIKMR